MHRNEVRSAGGENRIDRPVDEVQVCPLCRNPSPLGLESGDNNSPSRRCSRKSQEALVLDEITI